MLKGLNLGRISGRQWCILICLLMVAVIIISVTISKQGAILSTDSGIYLNAAKSLRVNGTFQRTVYNPDRRVVEHTVYAHYPPLVPAIWGGFMALGLGPGTAVIVSNSVTWFFFLIFVFLLTYVLTLCGWASLMATALASVTTSFFYAYLHALSETIFLPLLLSCIVATVIYPRTTSSIPVKHLVLLCISLALTSMTRYSSICLFVAIFVWFSWLRLPTRQFRLFFWEMIGLALSAMPMIVWMTRNLWLSGSSIGGHGFEGFAWSNFLSAIAGVFTSMIGGILPPLFDWDFLIQARNLFSSSIVVLVVLTVITTALLLLLRHTRFTLEAVHRYVKTFPKAPYAPLILFVMSYLALYIFMEPFMSFWPMDRRDFTSVLVLAQPICVLVLVRMAQRWPQYKRWLQSGLAIYVILFLLSIPIQWDVFSTRGMRTHTLEKVYSETWKYLCQNMETDDVLIVDAEDIGDASYLGFAATFYQPIGSLTKWLNSPSKCQPPQSGRAWIVLLNGLNEPNNRKLLEQVCPDLVQHKLSDGIIYEISW